MVSKIIFCRLSPDVLSGLQLPSRHLLLIVKQALEMPVLSPTQNSSFHSLHLNSVNITFPSPISQPKFLASSIILLLFSYLISKL